MSYQNTPGSFPRSPSSSLWSISRTRSARSSTPWLDVSPLMARSTRSTVTIRPLNRRYVVGTVSHRHMRREDVGVRPTWRSRARGRSARGGRPRSSAPAAGTARLEHAQYRQGTTVKLLRPLHAHQPRARSSRRGFNRDLERADMCFETSQVCDLCDLKEVRNLFGYVVSSLVMWYPLWLLSTLSGYVVPYLVMRYPLWLHNNFECATQDTGTL